ncbi:MAG: hypothetical protein JSR25_08375 [Proteobacteria bacterium]|nr:hypothetical protein [Pseudomonadota bacterium]
MTDLLQMAAFFLRQWGRLGVRSAARPGKKPGFQQKGYRFPDHAGQVFTFTAPAYHQAIENKRFSDTFVDLKTEFSAMLKPQSRPSEKNHA